MAEHDVQLVPGIGPKTANHLEKLGIFTVNDLLAKPASDLKTKKWQKKAQIYLKQVNTPVVSRESEPTKNERYLISTHNWFEKAVTLPVEIGEKGEFELRRVVIYELSVESYNRVSFLCSYFENNKQFLCTFTKSPLYILSFNIDTLPKFELTLSKSFFEALPNNYAVYDTLREIYSIQQLKK